MKKLVCLNFSGAELDQAYWQEVDKLVERRVNVSNENTHLDAEGLLVKLGAKVPKDLIDRLPKLKYIGMFGTGYGGIDAQYAAEKKITVTNIADYATEAVAEFSFGILLDHLRQITKAKEQAKIGNYSDEEFSGGEIKSKIFGIVGLGHIGTRIAELAQAFGANVMYWSEHRKDDAEKRGVEYSDTVIGDADILSVNLALNPETENYFNADKIDQIKKGAVVINLSPMELFEFEALVERLKKNDIVFLLDHSDEMSSEQLAALKPFANCIIYPPIAYLTVEATKLKKQIYIDNLKNFLAGNPTNKVN